jgi:AI-2 transport protein TqsA
MKEGHHGRLPSPDDAECPRAWDAEDGSADETTPFLGEAGRLDDEEEGLEHCISALCRVASVALVVGLMLLVLFSIVSLLVRGAMDMKENWAAYGAGLQRLLDWMNTMTDTVSKRLSLKSDPQFKQLYNHVLAKVQDTILVLVDYIVSGFSSMATSLIVVLLYVLFWLLKPLPFGGKASALVRSYIWKKTLVSFIYGASVALLFASLGIDLAIFFGMVSFFLNYVPEVGSIISILVPMPVIILDGRLSSPLLTMGIAALGQVLLKLAFNNFLELKLVEQDQEMSIHPVWVLLNLNYFGFVWGPIGMLISVPMLALVKSFAISETETSEELAPWFEPLLSCLEGVPGRPALYSKRASQRASLRRAAGLLPAEAPWTPKEPACPAA